jgi:anti-sigma regulatory factor (Ser/Thr protein kinase)
MIADQARLGRLSAVKAGNMSRILDRIQGAVASNAAEGTWHTGQFRKRFPIDTLAPALSRAALATTTIGIPVDAFQVAALLVSEMVTNSVKHAQTDWVEVAISLTPQVLRVEVSDQDRRTIRPRTPDVDGGGWGLALVGELATRWGVERHPQGKTVWIEIDLTSSS